MPLIEQALIAAGSSLVAENGASSEDVFEYACHEGNYAMSNILGGARRAELAAKTNP